MTLGEVILWKHLKGKQLHGSVVAIIANWVAQHQT
jgi:hypothetical protein